MTGLPPSLPLLADWKLVQCCPALACPLWLRTAVRPGQLAASSSLASVPLPCSTWTQHGPHPHCQVQVFGAEPEAPGVPAKSLPLLCSSLGPGHGQGRCFLSQLAVAEPGPKLPCPMVPPPRVSSQGCERLPARMPMPSCWFWWVPLWCPGRVAQQPPSKLWVCSPSVPSLMSGPVPRTKLWCLALGQPKGPSCTGLALLWAERFHKGPSAPLPLGFAAARARQALSLRHLP